MYKTTCKALKKYKVYYQVQTKKAHFLFPKEDCKNPFIHLSTTRTPVQIRIEHFHHYPVQFYLPDSYLRYKYWKTRNTCFSCYCSAVVIATLYCSKKLFLLNKSNILLDMSFDKAMFPELSVHPQR